MKLLSFLRKHNLKTTHFVLIASVLNLVLFHLPFFQYVVNHVDYKSFNGVLLIISLVVAILLANALVFYVFCAFSRRLGKTLLVVFFILNAISVYFIFTYSTIIDEEMIGNVFHTNLEESSSFFSLKLVLFVLILGLLPSIYFVKANVSKTTLKDFAIKVSLTLVALLVIVFVNASNWLWIDKNDKQVGGLVMPWSYTVNASLFQLHKYRANKQEILLPNAQFGDNKKSVVVLVIGESARSQNFSLYGYPKNTNPLLSKEDGVYRFSATSCATYTTAALKCILEHTHTDDLYEILPNYLYRNDVDVVWRTTNSGEPPIRVEKIQGRKTLLPLCEGDGCGYDGILLAGLKEQILSSDKSKILIVLHTSTSHGPTYNKKYPPQFETFKPVCSSVELGQCSPEELMNAYDNTIVYTDYILHQVIGTLKELEGYQAAMFYVSDHGESLGEKNLYMHGLPMRIAPKEQYEIPFIVWSSDKSKTPKSRAVLSQNHIFHSVLNFLNIKSPIYNEEMNIFK